MPLDESLSQLEFYGSESSSLSRERGSKTQMQEVIESENPVLWDDVPPPLLRKLIERGELPPPAPKQRHRDDSPEREPVRRTRPPNVQKKLQEGQKYRIYSSRKKAYITHESTFEKGCVEFTLPVNYYPRLMGIFRSTNENIQLHWIENGKKKRSVAELDLGEVDARDDFVWHEPKNGPCNDEGSSSESFEAGGTFASFLKEVIDDEVELTLDAWRLKFSVDEKRTKLKLRRVIYRRIENEWEEEHKK